MTIELKETTNPLKDIPEGVNILFHDGIGIDIGFRKGDKMIYMYRKKGQEEFAKHQLSLEYVNYFTVIPF